MILFDDLYVVDIILDKDDPAICQVPGGVGKLSTRLIGTKEDNNIQTDTITTIGP